MTEPSLAARDQPADTRGASLRTMLRLGLPLVAGMGGHALFNLVDLAMVGAAARGPTEAEAVIAGVSIASLVTTAPLVFMNGISNGTVPVVAQNFAARNHRRANQASRQALLIALVMSILLGVVPGFFAGDIARAFRAAPGLEFELARDFLAVMSFHAWSGFLLLQITANMRAVGMGLWTMVLLLTSNFGNLVLNWLLIFGNLGFPEMGPMGAAWATVWARGAAAVIGLVVLFRTSEPSLRLTLGGWRPRARFALEVARKGFPVAGQWTVRMAAVLLVLLVVSPFGAAEKAAYGIGTRLDTLALFAGFGWAAACAALVGHAVAQKRIREAREVTRHAAVLNVVMMSLAGAVYFVFARDLIGLFSLGAEEPPVEVLNAGRRYLRVEILAYPALALSVIWAHALNGAGSVKTPLLLDAIGLLLVQVPLAFWLVETPLGAAGAWWALVVSHSLLALVYYLVFRAGAWERKRLR